MGCVQMLCLRQLFALEEDSIADEGVWEEPSSSAHRRLCVGDTFFVASVVSWVDPSEWNDACGE